MLAISSGGRRLRYAPGALVFRYRDYLAPALVVAAVLASRPSDFIADGSLDTCAAVAGAALIALGLGMRFVVAGQVDIRRSGLRRQVAASRLVTAGLYAHTRNPLYVANVILVVALALVFDSRRAYAVPPLVALALLAVVLLEEEFLAAKFGDEYGAYCARVRRFVPRLGGLGATLAATPMDWRRAARREYGPVFATVSVALVLAATKDVVRSGFERAVPRLPGYGAAWIVCLGAWLLVRRLKKRGRLETPPLPACVAG